jgi:ribosomal protein S12 methylthiotransferase accessory factor
VAATRGWTIVSTRHTAIRIRSDGTSFILEALPWLAQSGAGPVVPGWVSELRGQLESAGITGLARRSENEPDRELVVAAARETALVGAVREELSRVGVKLAAGARADFVLADMSDLDDGAAAELARDLHAAGRRSVSLWRRGAELLLGPWCEPDHTACWNCCRVRLSDLPPPDGERPVEPDAAFVRAVAENVVLAVRHPELTPYGCVVSDQHQTTALHSIVPLPWCAVCGGAAQMPEAELVPCGRTVLVPDELAGLADARGGVVRRVALFDTNGPSLPVCASAHVGPYENGDPSRPACTGEGKGATRDAAVRSAIGEGLERYSASLWDPAALTRASPRDLGSAAFDPRWLVLYRSSEYQQPSFGFAPFDPDLPLPWVEGCWIDTGEPVKLPALASYMNFPAAPAERFAQITSNGLAAGSTFEDAALRGLYELIERDAFMLHWLAKRPGLRLDPGGCDAVTECALGEIDRFGGRTELYVLDVGTHHPCVVCVGSGDGRSWPGVTIGLAAHADIDVALQRAVLEHGHFGAYVRRLMLEGAHRHISSAENVTGALDHAIHYLSPSSAAALGPLRSLKGEPVTLAALRSRYSQQPTLSSCVESLNSIGVRAAAVDVTSPDVALAPIRVVRAFGTFMQPIHFGYSNRRLANPRLDALLTGAPEREPHPLA